MGAFRRGHVETDQPGSKPWLLWPSPILNAAIVFMNDAESVADFVKEMEGLIELEKEIDVVQGSA